MPARQAQDGYTRRAEQKSEPKSSELISVHPTGPACPSPAVGKYRILFTWRHGRPEVAGQAAYVRAAWLLAAPGCCGRERPPAQCGLHPSAGPWGSPVWTWEPQMLGIRPRLPVGLPTPHVAPQGGHTCLWLPSAQSASARPLTGPSHRPLFVDGAALREWTCLSLRAGLV